MILRKTMLQLFHISKVNESNFIKAVDKTNLSEQTKSRLSEIIGINKLNKHVGTFDYIGKILIVLRATSSGVSIILFTSIVGAPVGIASASLTFFFL